MEYTNLGKSGLKISKVILGAMSYGDPKWQNWVLSEEESLPLLEYAYKVGIRTWDTANVYSNGRSEEIIGKAIKKFSIPRERLVILSKCYFGVDPDNLEFPISAASVNDGDMLNQQGLSRKNIINAVDQSVARLGTYIDVLQIHRLDRDTPKEEIMRALNDVVESGKVRYIGASSMAAWEFQMLQNIAEKNGWHKFVSMQNYYNLIYREEENEMIPYCNYTGVGLIPWSPIARGVLARPYDSRESEREKSDNYLKSTVRGKEASSDRLIAEHLEQVAKKLDKTMAQVATAWCIQKGTMPIVGLNKTARMDEAIEACKIRLDEEDVKFLEECYVPRMRQGY